MPLRFIDICTLLHQLEKVERRDVPLLRPIHEQVTRTLVEDWFKQHRTVLHAPSANGVAILSTLFPERRTDRVYALQETRLSRLFSRCLLLSAENARRVEQYRQPGQGDLAECFEKVLRVHDDNHRPSRSVTVDEVDRVLHDVAASRKFSSPAVRKGATGTPVEDLFAPLLRRMRSNEIKWLVRLVLKDFSPVTINYERTIATYHFLLPSLLRFQNSFEAATEMLKGPLVQYPAQPDKTRQVQFKHEAASLIKPRIGVQVGRPTFHKARSMNHCLKLIDKKRWSIERKYDGEYCQIHVDLQDSAQPIKIFSKNGKDSTADRKGLLPTLKECLGLGMKHCKFERQCILLGELVVFCDERHEILPFHHIRKHVTRSGRLLGTWEDSPPRACEHLMIIFFDVLLLDHEITLTKPHSERREILTGMINKKFGYAMTSEWRIINFSEHGSDKGLMWQFAASIALGYEGLILKPADAAYFSLLNDEPGTWHSGFIKLKKDYMQVFGEDRDIADLAVVGASYNARRSLHSSAGAVQYTTFHLGCIVNRDALRFGRLPVFKIIGLIDAEACVSRAELEALNNIIRFHSRALEQRGGRLANPEQYDLQMDGESAPKIDVVLHSPPVVEVLGSGFEKPSDRGFYMLRHPRILKLHLDRAWQHSTTFDDLQEMAEASMHAPAEGDSEEMTRMIEKMQRKLREKVQSGELSSTITSRSPVTTRSSVSPRSPLAQRRDGGNGNTASGSPSVAAAAAAKKASGRKTGLSPAQGRASPEGFDGDSIGDFVILEDNEPPVTGGHPIGLATPPTSSGVDVENQPPCEQRRPLDPKPPTRSKKRAASETAIDCTSKRVKLDQHETRQPAALMAGAAHQAVSPNRIRCTAGPDCAWAACVFLLSPCVAGMPLLTEDLIPAHGGSAITVDVGSESDRWKVPGEDVAKRRVVLVEPLRPAACRSIVDRMAAQGIRGEIEFWDWRALQKACLERAGEAGSDLTVPTGIDVDGSGGRRAARGFLWGRSWWCEGSGTVQFKCFYR